MKKPHPEMLQIEYMIIEYIIKAAEAKLLQTNKAGTDDQSKATNIVCSEILHTELLLFYSCTFHTMGTLKRYQICICVKII